MWTSVFTQRNECKNSERKKWRITLLLFGSYHTLQDRAARYLQSILPIQISVSPEGITSRGILPSHECRSSASQFCCNENFCNHLPSPPLPAFTNLKCSVGKCFLSNGICVYDADYVTTLSSPTESCSVSHCIDGSSDRFASIPSCFIGNIWSGKLQILQESLPTNY